MKPKPTSFYKVCVRCKSTMRTAAKVCSCTGALIDSTSMDGMRIKLQKKLSKLKRK